MLTGFKKIAYVVLLHFLRHWQIVKRKNPAKTSQKYQHFETQVISPFAEIIATRQVRFIVPNQYVVLKDRCY